MSNRGYNLTIPMVKLYYRVVGIDDSKVDYEKINLNVKMIEDISPVILFNLNDMLSYQLDDNMILLLEKIAMCTINQEDYLKSVNVILKAVSNLNLIDNDLEDYVLYFKRLSYLLNVVISELNALSIENTIRLRKAIDSGSYDNIDSFSYIVPNISHILLLSMNPNNNISDYQIYKDKFGFNNKEINLRLGEVFKLISQNKWDVSNLKFDETSFNRLSLEKSNNMTKF